MKKVKPENDGDYQTLPSWLKPGISFWVYFNEGNPNNDKYHVRAFVDHGVVIRRWRKHKNRWHYEFESPIYFQCMKEHILIEG